MSDHPSSFALDCVALGETPAPALDGHLAGCARCRAYLEGRRRAPAQPPWLATVPRPRRWRLPVAAGLVAAAAALLIVARTPPTLRVKGPPSVLVYLKRNEVVSAWQPPTPLRGGDQIRLQVRAAGFDHVSVAALPAGGAPQILYAGPLAGDDPHWLPFSLQADAEGDREVLSIALGTASIAPATHLREPRPADGLWATRLTMPKEGPTPSASSCVPWSRPPSSSAPWRRRPARARPCWWAPTGRPPAAARSSTPIRTPTGWPRCWSPSAASRPAR
jgi:hypothetical protein